MAEIIPFKAWRYHPQLSEDIGTLTSPLFDVLSDEEQKKLYKNPLNSIHLSVPQGDHPHLKAAEVLNKWKMNGTIIQDQLPGIYVYYQFFKLPNDDKQYCRKGFICNIRAYEWDEMVVLRHENTIPSSVNNRIELLEATEMQVSPTHGLYSDPSFELEKLMDESIKYPTYSSMDYQGVKDVMSIIQDKKKIRFFIELLKDKQVILADGHHRYEASLAFKRKSMAQNPHHSGNEGYNFHMIYLSNSESDDIKILPTHRIAKGIEGFNEEDFIKSLEKDFYIQPVERNLSRISRSIEGLKWMFGIVLPSYTFLIQLKPESFNTLRWNFPEKIKELDLTVLHYFVIEQILGIKGKDQRKTVKIGYERSLEVCNRLIINGYAQLAMITQPVSMKEIKEVCFSGYTLPQKSTYFYPKVVTGFLFNSIKENEFTIIDSGF